MAGHNVDSYDLDIYLEWKDYVYAHNNFYHEASDAHI